MKVHEALGKTDWALLAQQKLTLVTLLSAPNRLFDPETEHLQGLLHFLDAIQDAAEEDGFPVVFLTE